MAALYTNNASTTLASGITNSATSLTVTSGNGTKFPSPTGIDYFMCTLQGASGTPIEIIKVTARSTDTFTIVRAQEGTTASAFNANDIVELRVTAAEMTQINQLGQGNASIMKNRIINGAMVIDQRNAGASVTVPISGSAYPVDRFYVNRANGYANTATAQQITDGPAGFQKSLKYTSGTAESVTGALYSTITQIIEGYNIADLGWGTSSALVATVSFWVKISTTGTFGVVLRSGDNSLSYAATFTVSSANTWQYVTLLIPAPTTGGTTAFPITNGTGFSVFFDLGTGPTLSISATGAWQSANALGVTGTTKLNSLTGATYQITGVQLEVGSSATGFEYVNYQTSLANCQRYYEVIYNGTGGDCWYSPNTGTPGYRYFWNFKVEKRAQPSFSIGSSTTWYGTTPANYSSTSGVGFYTASTSYGPQGTNGTVATIASAEL